ncbi:MULTISPECIES: magnesium and cobalt transport protein CorA [unclassified Agrococcus]|uniref:magnesium and cobalt transport protein CorA n=1 Tax=unclassified Agrococcus TaxID=2615065 RepID=UPI00360861AA
MPIIDNAVYVDGRRIDDPASLEQTFEHMRDASGMAWIGLLRPTEAELQEVATELSLHPLAVEDALEGHQRAKLERYGDTLFVVLRPARYVDDREAVEFGELHVFVGADFVVTVRHAEGPDLAAVRARMEGEPDLLRLGPQAVLYAILDQVVDDYAPVVHGLQADIDEIDDSLFQGGDAGLARRIYELAREIVSFQRATTPLVGMLETLRDGAESAEVDVELRRSLRDVLDHVIRVNERAAAFRGVLHNALTVNATLVTERHTETALAQNESVKKISGWAAILFAPSLVAAVYGMNFDRMPELHWAFGYPMALALMAATSVALYAVFRIKRWL